MTIYLVRHAQPLVEGGICYGASDVACSPQVMQSAAEQLLHQLPQGLLVVSSPLQRCEQLAQILCRLEPSFGFKTDLALAEMDFGNWEMRRWDAIAPHELAAWTDDFAHYRCGGSGESTGQFVQRVAGRLARTVQAGRDEIWITHAGVMRALLWLQQAVNLTQAPAQPLALPDDLLCRLRAADWPKDEVAFAQVQTWHWEKA